MLLPDYCPITNKQAESGNASLIFISATRLDEDTEGLLVDPGAHDNLVGSAWVSRTMQLMQKHKYPETVVLDRIQPIGIGGVGQGSVTTSSKVRVPIMLEDGTQATFDAPMLGDLDKDLHQLPALLGLKSLEAMNAVLDMRPGQRKLYFGTSSGVTIQSGTQCKVLKLRKSESGHLMLPVTSFQKRVVTVRSNDTL